MHLYCAFYVYSQSDTVTCCRFYTYNDEQIFKMLENNTQSIDFMISHNPTDSLAERLNHFLGLKKGIISFNVNHIKENELNVILITSPLFDAHYLRLIMERNMKIPYVSVNENLITWDEFEKMFLKKATNY